MDHTSGWNVYYLIFVSGLFGLVLPVLGFFANRLLRLGRTASKSEAS